MRRKHHFSLLLLLLLGGAGVLLAQTDSLPDSTHIEVTPTTTIIAPLDTSYQEVEVLTEEQKQKYNRRYQIGGALAMMVFVGVLIGSVQTFNPK